MKKLIIALLIIGVSFTSYALQEDWVRIKSTADEVVKGCQNPEEKVWELSHYVHEKLHPDTNFPSNAIMSTMDRLDSGVGWCNHQVAVFMALARTQGIKTRMLYLLNKEGTASPHTIGEALINGKWVVVDPMIDLMKRNENNELISRYDIMKNPKYITENPIVKDDYSKAYRKKFAEFFWYPAIVAYELE